MKRTICLILSIMMVLSVLVGCQAEPDVSTNPPESSTSTQTQESTSRETPEPETTEPVVEEQPETQKAREMGLIPAEWDSDLSVEADFAGFNQLIVSLITLCDESALSIWNETVDTSAFPQRNMQRDDGLVLLMLAAEALGFNCYNAREYGFCTENFVDYDSIFSQISWDYPYCNTEREIPMYFDKVGGEQHQQQMRMGSTGGMDKGQQLPELDEMTATRWVESLEGEDKNHPKGGKWSEEQLEPIAKKFGVPTKGPEWWEFYAVTNAMYADYSEVAKAYNITSPDYYAKLALAFIRDKDALPGKVQRYLRYVVGM